MTKGSIFDSGKPEYLWGVLFENVRQKVEVNVVKNKRNAKKGLRNIQKFLSCCVRMWG